MHITEWEASRSGAGITVSMTDAGGVRRKQFVKRIVGKDGGVVALGGDGARFPLKASFVDKLSDAEIAVLYERQRHVQAEGWTPEHDDEHSNGELAQAAACYAMGDYRIVGRDSGDRAVGQATIWPWQLGWWKPSDHRRNCVKAAALLIAEIERMDRAASVDRSPEGEKPQALNAKHESAVATGETPNPTPSSSADQQ